MLDDIGGSQMPGAVHRILNAEAINGDRHWFTYCN